MSEYTLEIKQIVDYPRCRIYRQFVQALIADRSIRVSGGSGLFYFVVLFKLVGGKLAHHITKGGNDVFSEVSQ